MRYNLDKLQNIEEWHRWFSWYPIVIDNHVVWLEKVERKFIAFPILASSGYWLYRDIKE